MEFLRNIQAVVDEVKANNEGINEEDFLKKCSDKGLEITRPGTFLRVYYEGKRQSDTEQHCNIDDF